jgi:hypothetical protein
VFRGTTQATLFQDHIPTPCGAKRETKVTSSRGGFANHPDAYPAKSQDFGEHEKQSASWNGLAENGNTEQRQPIHRRALWLAEQEGLTYGFQQRKPSKSIGHVLDWDCIYLNTNGISSKHM